MSFRDNLQYLRAQRNMTQEQLAMLLGVSRQAISKWESDKAYPEMDKLLMICDLFGVTLDDLVIGDVRTPVTHAETAHLEDTDGARPPKAVTGAGMPPLPEPSALPQDITGYDEHMRSFDRRISTGVFAVIFGVGVGLLFTGEHALPVSPSFGDFLVFLCVAIGVLVALAFFIPAGLDHAEFMRRHPFVEDFYTREDRQQAMRTLTISLIFGIGLILIALAFLIPRRQRAAYRRGMADRVVHDDHRRRCRCMHIRWHELCAHRRRGIQQGGSARGTQPAYGHDGGPQRRDMRHDHDPCDNRGTVDAVLLRRRTERHVLDVVGHWRTAVRHLVDCHERDRRTRHETLNGPDH